MNTDDEPLPIDDVQSFHAARREAGVVLVLWIITFLWTVGYSYAQGYHDSPHQTPALPPVTPFGLGIPAWTFWGVLVPWLLCILFSIWFALFRMADDEVKA